MLVPAFMSIIINPYYLFHFGSGQRYGRGSPKVDFAHITLHSHYIGALVSLI